MRVFLDTNVLAYAFDDADPPRQRRAREVLTSAGIDRRISTQVLIELHSVLTRRLGRSLEQAEQIVRAVELPTLPTDRDLVLRAARTADEHQLSIFDALILEAAVRSSCQELWTEDLSSGTALRGVRIVNPFA